MIKLSDYSTELHTTTIPTNSGHSGGVPAYLRLSPNTLIGHIFSGYFSSIGVADGQ